MTTATIDALNLDGKTPSELEARRREIVQYLLSMPKGYDDENVPESVLHELAVITGALRRRTAGPPKAKKPTGTAGPKPTVDNLLF